MSRLDAIEQQLTKLTKAVSDLSGYVKVMDEVHTGKLAALTSQQRELPLTLPPDEETRNRLTEIEKTLSAIAAQLSSSEAVRLPSGESVKRSDLDSLMMVKSINDKLTTMSTASAELAEAVRRRGQVKIDMDRLSEHAVKVLDSRLIRAVQAPVVRVERALRGFEERVAVVGAGRAAEASQEVDRVISKADEVVVAVRAAERRVDDLNARVTWTTVGRLALALVPLAGVLIVVGGLVGGVSYALGLGPLLGWAWASFSASDVWWMKVLIALGTLAAVTLFGWLVWWLARKLSDEFGRW